MSAASKHAARGKGRRRTAVPLDRPRGTFEFGREQFRFTARRHRGPVKLPTVNLDQFVTSAEWGRSGAKMTGQVEMQAPEGRTLRGLIAKGDVIRCEIRRNSAAKWRPLWEMTARRPARSVRDDTATVALSSTLAQGSGSRRSWRFRKDKNHPRGWRAHEVAAEAARRMHYPVGRLAEARHFIAKLVDKHASLPEIVTQAYAEEREHEGRRFDVSIASGVLEVTELRRPRYMLLLGQQVIDAVLAEGLPDGYASAVIVTSTVKATGSTKRRKIKVKVIDRARIRRDGYIVKRVSKSGLDTEQEARRFGRNWLARRAKPFSEATLTLPGIPWVDRGDSVKLNLPKEGLTAVVYVTNVRHRLGYGSYEMDVTVRTKDPWTADERKRRVARKKAEARRRRGRSSSTSTGGAVAPPAPAKSGRRS